MAYSAYRLPQIDSLCLIIVMIICGSLVAQCWKYIISSALKFDFNPLTWDAFWPLIVVQSAYFFPDFGNGILILGALIIWAYNMVFFISNITHIAKGINVQIFSIKKKAE